MFDAFVSLALMAPTALFGRRKGGDRHGEINGSPTAGDEGHDAFSAFEGLLDDSSTDSALPIDGSLALAPDRHDIAAGDHRSADDEPSDGASDPPGWVVGDTSLDGPVTPDPPNGHASVVPDEELWHPAPGDESRSQPLAPFEEQIASVGPAGDVWGPIATEPLSVADGDQMAPFRLNRLRKVAGPEADDLRHPVTAGPLDGPGAASANGHPPFAGANRQLIRGPVGRSRGRTSGRPIRRPAPHGSSSGIDRAGTNDPATTVHGHDHHPVEPVAEVVEAPAAPVPVFVAADGMVSTGSGSVRVARPEDASASAGADGLVVQLVNRWCWAALDEFGPDLTVRAGSTVLQVPAGTTALLSIDEDGAQLVVVLDGEGVVEHDGGRIRLRSGAMAYLPVDGDPQVDVAADEEIRSDPLVARNLALDKA